MLARPHPRGCLPLMTPCPLLPFLFVRTHVPAHRMLLRQHQSIDSLTEVVKTQANTIAGLVSLLGAGGTTAAVGGGRRPLTRATGGTPTAGPRGGGGFTDDEDAIAEMVAYLHDAKAPNTSAAAAAAAAPATGNI